MQVIMYNRQFAAMVMVALALAATPLIVGTAFAASDPNTKVRAIQNGVSLDGTTEGVLGMDVSCVSGIEGSGAADEVMCYLVPDGIPTPSYASTPIPPQTAAAEGSCPSGVGFTSGFVCFTTTFDSALFTEGDWRFVSVFYKDGQIVDVEGSNEWTNHTFLVVPETPIGIFALVVSSLAVLGGFMFLRGRSHAQASI